MGSPRIPLEFGSFGIFGVLGVLEFWDAQSQTNPMTSSAVHQRATTPPALCTWSLGDLEFLEFGTTSLYSVKWLGTS